MAPHPEVYPENVPGPESSTERASIPEHHPGPDVLSVPSALEQRTVLRQLSQELAQVHKFPLVLAPNPESAPEPVPVCKLVQMLLS